MQNVKINGRWDILLPDHRAARPEWYTEQGWERKRLDSMHEHLNSKDVIFYVGAEEGDMAGLLSSWGVAVGMFEPNGLVWPNIKAIWEANKLAPPLFCFSGFASTCNVDIPDGMSYGFPPSANGPVIGNHGFKELSDPGKIPQIRIDAVGIVPTALSIDVEGSEWEVLRGAEKTLREHHPKIWLSIHPEFMFNYFKEYSGDLRNWIKEIGYKETILDYQHELHVYYEPKN